MSRANKRHNRQIERHRRNNGPSLLSRIADNTVGAEAENIVNALVEAIKSRHNTTAARLLVELAESADHVDPSLVAKVKSLAERWAKEPQVVELATAPQFPAVPPKARLTDGTRPAPESGSGDPGILEGEWEMMPVAVERDHGEGVETRNFGRG